MNAPLTLAEGLALAEYIDTRDGVIRRQNRVRLSWSGTHRWVLWDLPCLTCGQDTHARDRAGLPIHPACAEAELADQLGASRRDS